MNFFLQYIMMKNPRPKEKKIITDIRNLFRLKKKQSDSAIKSVRNLFRLKTEIKAIKIQYLEILRTFLSMKKKKIFIKQQEEIIFRAIIILNTKVMVIKTEY